MEEESEEEYFAGDGYMGKAKAVRVKMPDDVAFSLSLSTDSVSHLQSTLSVERSIEFLKSVVRMLEEGRVTFDKVEGDADRLREAEG